MPLPKISIPTQTFTLPLSKKKIIYRYFTVREEKILLIAAESKTLVDRVQAFEQVINNCIITEDVDVDTLPMFDLEVLFLLLRINSISNIAEIRIQDTIDNEVYDLQINLQQMVDEIIAKNPAPDTTLQLSENIGVVMRFITLADFKTNLLMQKEEQTAEDSFKILTAMIDKVFDDDNVFNLVDFTEEEVMDFTLSLPQEALQTINNFVQNLPRCAYKQPYVRKDGSEGSLEFDGLADFFHYV